jgi:hypothetical protein
MNLSELRTSFQYSKFGGDSSTGEEIVSQSDEGGAIVFDFLVNLATDILQSPLSWKPHVYNEQREKSRQHTDLHILRI